MVIATVFGLLLVLVIYGVFLWKVAIPRTRAEWKGAASGCTQGSVPGPVEN